MAEPIISPPADHNRPPLIEVAKHDIGEQLAPLQPRLNELIASAAKATCTTEEEAGKCADLVKLLRKLRGQIDNVRKDVKAEYTEAADVVQAAGNAMFRPLDEADGTVRGLMTTFARAEATRKANEQRQRDADAAAERERERQARALDAERSGNQGGVMTDAAPTPAPAPAPARRSGGGGFAAGDYGAKASTSTRKVPVIVDAYALPPEVMNAPKVRDAMLSVIRAMRQANPEIEIKGVEVQDELGVAVR